MSRALNLPPPPLFTLRGHESGVTALTSFKKNDINFLVSGDESGNIIIWSLTIYRIVTQVDQFSTSRIQSLRVINLSLNGNPCHVLVVQTRDDGVHLLNLDDFMVKNECPKSIKTFPTTPSIFSRGDAINIETEQAILAYPSFLESYLVTVRLLTTNADTLLSGTAQRSVGTEKGRTVFDISIKQLGQEFILLVAYEDGYLCQFRFSMDSLKTVPHLESTGLKIDQIKNYDLKINDFISAFDCHLEVESGNALIYCGSPLAELFCIADNYRQCQNHEQNNFKLSQSGVSVLRVRADGKIFAFGCWDSTVRVYSTKSSKILATLRYHNKQVADLLFVEKTTKPSDKGDYLLCCGSAEGTISITCIY